MGKVRGTKYDNRRRRRRRRRTNTGFLFGLISVIVILGAAFAAILTFFKISTITVTGQSRYSATEIREASGIKVGGNLFLINKFASIRSVFDQLVYLDEIQMRRHLPNEIEIIVKDCIPVAYVEDSGNYWLIDKKGKILENTTTAPKSNLTIIKGAATIDSKVGAMLKLSDADKQKPLFDILNSAETNGILNKISEINLNKLYDIRFQYEGRFEVVLGSTGELEKKMRFFKTVIERLGAEERGVIDLSDPTTARFRPEITGG